METRAFTAVVGAMAFFAILVVALWLLAKLTSGGGASEPDAPGIASVALIGFQPSGPWQQLDDEATKRAGDVFRELLDAVAAEGVRFREPVFEDWGLFSSAGPWMLSFGPLDDESGWKLVVERSGRQPLSPTEATHQVLALLDKHLRAAPLFTGVTWVKRESA